MLSVLLVTYCSAGFIDDCLAAVRATVATPHEVVAVDNASADGSLEHLRVHWPAVLSLGMGRNAGFAQANNLALEHSTGRYVLLLNGDAVVQPAALDRLVGYLDGHPDVAVVGPRLEYPDGRDQGTARSFPTPAAAVFGRRSPLTQLWPGNPWSRRYLRPTSTTSPYDVDWMSGACLMVRRSVVERVGPLDPGFFMHWEDADWCRRIKTAGGRVVCVPAAVVVHAEGGSRRGWPLVQVVAFHRGAYRYYAKHHLGGPLRALRPLAAALLTLRGGLVLARGGRRPAAGA